MSDKMTIANGKVVVTTEEGQKIVGSESDLDDMYHSQLLPNRHKEIKIR